MTHQRARRAIPVARPRAVSRPAQTVVAALACMAVLVAPLSAASASTPALAVADYAARPFAEVGASVLSPLVSSGPRQSTASSRSAIDPSLIPLGQLSEVTPHDLQVLTTDALSTTESGPADGQRYVSPVPGPITGPYGPRFHPILRYMRMHNGVDMTAACGVPVVAMTNGTVTRAAAAGGYGNLVEVDHGTVDGDRVASRYAHLSVIGVRTGSQVQRGQVIGLAGTTGLSTGCHLHFEVLINGRFVDPGAVLSGAPHAQLVPMSQLLAMPTPTPHPSLIGLTPSPTPTTSPTADPSGTPTIDLTGTPSPGASGTPSPSPSGTPSPGASGTPTADASPTPSTGTPSTGTPSAEPTGTPHTTATPTPSPSATPQQPAPTSAPPAPQPEPTVTTTTATATSAPSPSVSQRTAAASPPPDPSPTAG